MSELLKLYDNTLKLVRDKEHASFVSYLLECIARDISTKRDPGIIDEIYLTDIATETHYFNNTTDLLIELLTDVDNYYASL